MMDSPSSPLCLREESPCIPSNPPVFLSFLLQFAFIAIALASSTHAAEQLGFRVPDGFEITHFADDDLAHDIFSMTIDAKGRVTVAGRGYVKILHDDDDDGRADRATLFSPVPKSGAHGMVWDGPHLVCTGDNSVMRLYDRNGDDKADTPDKPEVWTQLRHPEHGANGIVKGPDGWFYLICGNDAGLGKQHANLPTSPVKQPSMGAVVRFAPDSFCRGKWSAKTAGNSGGPGTPKFVHRPSRSIRPRLSQSLRPVLQPLRASVHRRRRRRA